MDSQNMRSKIVTAFKINGLSLRSEASTMLLEVLSEVEPQDFQKWLQKVIDAVQKQPLTSTFVSKEFVEIAIDECREGTDEEGDKIFNIIDAFKIPRFVYNAERKKFTASDSKKLLHGEADDKSNMFLERYTVIYQRVLHHELFTPATIAGADKSSKFSLKPVEHLLSCSGSLGDIIVLGMLTSLKEGVYYLEDPSGAVECNLTKTVFHKGIFTENCFVLAEGSYDDAVFTITALGLPPIEPAHKTRSYYGNINFFGGPSKTCVASSVKLKQVEQDEVNQNNMFVFVADLWLDDAKVMAKFKTLLSGYSECPPYLFVICGNFLSKPHGTKQLTRLKKHFSQLGDVISKYPSLLESSRFLFLPGPNDPGPGNILPHPPISKLITDELCDKVPFAEFVSNPCRIQYCSQEMLIYRDDIINKLCRNSIHLPKDDTKDLAPHFAETLLSQSHLCPLPLNTRPIYWSYDNALRLYPLPDLVVCADKYDPFTIDNAECKVVNPGSFARSKFRFKVYWPSTKEVEECKITT